MPGTPPFPGGVGNTQGDPKRFASLLGDVERKLFDRLPDETWFYQFRWSSARCCGLDNISTRRLLTDVAR